VAIRTGSTVTSAARSKQHLDVTKEIKVWRRFAAGFSVRPWP
jgi:hypothetical protein